MDMLLSIILLSTKKLAKEIQLHTVVQEIYFFKHIIVMCNLYQFHTVLENCKKKNC